MLDGFCCVGFCILFLIFSSISWCLKPCYSQLGQIYSLTKKINFDLNWICCGIYTKKFSVWNLSPEKIWNHPKTTREASSWSQRSQRSDDYVFQITILITKIKQYEQERRETLLTTLLNLSNYNIENNTVQEELISQ